LLFTITGKHIDVSENIKAHAREKTSKLPRFYDGVKRVEVIIDGSPGGNGENFKVEIIATGAHGNIFVVNEICDEPCKGIDIAVHKLERQLRRKKTKERNNKHTGS
jgi:ribosomal subunit interface protein